MDKIYVVYWSQSGNTQAMAEAVGAGITAAGKEAAVVDVSMSVVIVGGHDRMVCQYKKICKEHNCKAKVFTQMPAKLGNQIGSPDLIILFTNTVSHKMVRCAVAEAERCNADVVRSHTSSGSALTEILERVCG